MEDAFDATSSGWYSRSTALSPSWISRSQRLRLIHEGLSAVLRECRPELVAIENLFTRQRPQRAEAGHARGVAMLAAVEAGLAVVEYTPAEIKRAVVGYGRAEKHQVADMVRCCCISRTAPTPFDASDALAVAICHVHATGGAVALPADAQRLPRSWRQWRPPAGSRPS